MSFQCKCPYCHRIIDCINDLRGNGEDPWRCCFCDTEVEPVDPPDYENFDAEVKDEIEFDRAHDDR